MTKRNSRPFPALATGPSVPAKIHPADHMSIEVEYNFAPMRTSGGRYHRVTTCVHTKKTISYTLVSRWNGCFLVLWKPLLALWIFCITSETPRNYRNHTHTNKPYVSLSKKKKVLRISCQMEIKPKRPFSDHHSKQIGEKLLQMLFTT